MKRFPLNLAISCWLVFGWSGYSSGQCLSVKRLRDNLKTISAQSDIGGQKSSLLEWKGLWENCGYPYDSTYINGVLQIGLACYYQNDYAEGAQITQQAVRASQTKRADIAPDQVVKALYRLGMLYSLLSKQKEAIYTLNQAIQRGNAVESAAKWVGNSYLFLAYVYYSAGDYQRALGQADRGEEIANALQDTTLLTKLLQEKAKAYNILGLYKKARQNAERSVIMAQHNLMLRSVLTSGYRVLGAIAENQNQVAEALRYEQRAFEAARDVDDSFASSYAVQLGWHYYRLRQYDQAIPYFQFGIDHNTDPFAKSNSLNNLGAVYWQKKQFQRALSYYQQGLTTLPIGFRDQRIAALPDAQAIRQISPKDYLLSLIQDKADTWLDYAKTVRNNSVWLRHALTTYEVADQMIDYMRWEHTGQQSKLYWRKETRGLYERAIETCWRLNNPAHAFRFFEKSRAVMLTDKLNELGARQQLPTQQAKQEQQLQEAVSEQQDRLAGLTPDSSAYAAARADLLMHQERLDDFRKKLEATNRTYYGYKYDSTTTSLADLQRYLKARNASFVTYFVGDSALYVLGVTGDKATLRQQSVTAYNPTVREFMSLLADPRAMSRKAGIERFRALSHGLYRQLLAPLGLPTGRVIVSADGVSIPFETLSRSTKPNDYALNDHAFSYVYSARLLLKDRTMDGKSVGLAGDFLGMAPVDFSPTLQQAILPGSGVALHAIGERFGSPTMLLHGDATRRAFQTQAPNYRIIHLFTHATADSTDNEPMLYFADSTLRLSDLGDGALPNAQLVVLAACKTGIGANQEGEGVFSLARGFSALGVPSVITTLWSVQNEATYTLTKLFYQYLDEGLPKDVALQQAKLDWLKTAGGANELPNYWAGLILVGDAEPMNYTSYWQWWVAGGVFMLVVGGVGLWWMKQKRQFRTLRRVERNEVTG